MVFWSKLPRSNKPGWMWLSLTHVKALSCSISKLPFSSGSGFKPVYSNRWVSSWAHAKAAFLPKPFPVGFQVVSSVLCSEIPDSFSISMYNACDFSEYDSEDAGVLKIAARCLLLMCSPLKEKCLTFANHPLPESELETISPPQGRTK